MKSARLRVSLISILVAAAVEAAGHTQEHRAPYSRTPTKRRSRRRSSFTTTIERPARVA
jgi:hypothetical protein